jgi:hypothetical protein
MKRLFILLLLPFVLTGCLTSINPFFTDADIIRDDRLIGTYPDVGDKDVKFVITASHDHEGRYDIRIYDQHAWIAYVGTLFKIGDITFLDLYPSGDSAMRRDSGGPPTTTELLHSFTFQPLHLVIRVLPAAVALTYWTMDRRGLGDLLQSEPSLRPQIRGESLLLPQPAADLTKLLLKYGTSDKIFNMKATIKKGKGA